MSELGQVLYNGRPVGRDVMRAIRASWADGNRWIHLPIAEHRRLMRRLHSTYRARWPRR